MRKSALLAFVLLGACTTTAPPQPGPPSGLKCDATGADRFIGQPGNSQTGAEILRATHSAVLRWAPPGYALTMDYSESRVTVTLDPAYKITQVRCG